MGVLVYLVYGDDERFHLELTFSIASARKFMKDDPAGIRFALVCDEKNARHDLDLEHIFISAEDIRAWQFDGQYNHAIKPHVVRHALGTCQDKVAFVDTDTFFLAHPRSMFDRIGKARTLLCSDEATLADDADNSWAKTTETVTELLGRYPISLQTRMNNSGVIGIDPADAGLLDDVIGVMRELREIDKVFSAEQLAATMVFQTHTSVSFCTDEVDHYTARTCGYYQYQFKKSYPIRDRAAFQKLIETDFDWKLEPPIKLKWRILARLMMLRRGGDGAYASAYQSYLHAFDEPDDPELANVYSEQALDMLIYGCRTRYPFTVKDMARLSPTQLGNVQWLDRRNRTRWSDYWASYLG